MTESGIYNISIEKIKESLPEGKWIGMDDDFLILDIRKNDGRRDRVMEHPCRFDGFFILYCLKGHVTMSVNLNDFSLSGSMLFISAPGNIIKVTDVRMSQDEDVRLVAVAMSKEFVTGLNLDANKLFAEGMTLIENPCLCLGEQEVALSAGYLELIGKVLKADVNFGREAVRSLVSSLFYVMAGAWSAYLTSIRQDISAAPSRSRMVFEQFIRLVTEHHSRHRAVGFYADKLCLTPKYLSKVIKELTGRSAPQWIDAYVVLEAKNMLKYSNVTIKEVVYSLNFPNQSVFYKFFKSRTGMTPSEYRNS